MLRGSQQHPPAHTSACILWDGIAVDSLTSKELWDDAIHILVALAVTHQGCCWERFRTLAPCLHDLRSCELGSGAVGRISSFLPFAVGKTQPVSLAYSTFTAHERVSGERLSQHGGKSNLKAESSPWETAFGSTQALLPNSPGQRQLPAPGMLWVPRDSTGGDTGFGSTAGDPRQRGQEKSVCHTGLLLPCRDEEEPGSTWWWGSSHLPKTWSVLGSNSLGWHLKTCSSHACVLSHHSNPYRRGDICDGTAGPWTLTWPLRRCILNIPPVTPSLPPLELWWHWVLLCNPSAMIQGI